MLRATMRYVLPLSLLLLGGCLSETRAATGLPVPRQRADECRANCAELDMDLGAVVIIMSQAGCVCEPRGKHAALSPGAAAAAGGAVIAAVQQQQQQAAGAAAQSSQHR
jgi:hypothetical protein